jgi:Protein of unknown function (DUF2877)
MTIFALYNMDATMLSHSPTIFFSCKRIGSMHRKIASSEAGLFGTVVNVFDKTVNIKTNEDKLLVVGLGTVHSPLTINIAPLTHLASNNFSFNSFLDFLENSDQVVVMHKPKSSNQVEEVSTITHIKIGRCIILINKPVQFFQNNILRLKLHNLEKFVDYRRLLFSVLTRCASSQRAGCLLNPDKTTEGLLPEFLRSIRENHLTMDIRSPVLADKLSGCFLGLCGRGPGFTPAGDDFVGGFLAILNWIRISLKIGAPIIPGAECRKLTTWTSFKLMECNAYGLVDIQIQELINSIAKGSVLRYVDSLALIARRGHTSGIDFATGATVGLYVAIDSLNNLNPKAAL